MPNEIIAALIQAAPIAIVGWIGLDTWRRQLREAPQVEHAKHALAKAQPLFTAIRALRAPFVRLSVPEGEDIQAAWQRDTADRLQRVWNAWEHFQEHYVLASLFIEPVKGSDVAKEIENCIFDLQRDAELIDAWKTRQEPAGQPGRSGPPPAAGLHSLIGGERLGPLPFVPEEIGDVFKRFYGLEEDPIGNRLQKAQQMLNAQLRPILMYPNRGGR